MKLSSIIANNILKLIINYKNKIINITNGYSIGQIFQLVIK